MQIDEQNVYIDPTDENGAALFRRQINGEVVMLNLLRFRSVADYTDFPDLAPAEEVSGRDAYQEYMKGVGHRVAAVRDSRIVPLEDLRELVG